MFFKASEHPTSCKRAGVNGKLQFNLSFVPIIVAIRTHVWIDKCVGWKMKSTQKLQLLEQPLVLQCDVPLQSIDANSLLVRLACID